VESGRACKGRGQKRPKYVYKNEKVHGNHPNPFLNAGRESIRRGVTVSFPVGMGRTGSRS